jgi:hypothetical protein
MAGKGELAASGTRGPGTADLAAFTLDSRGRVACWPAAAAELFGLTAGAVTGHDNRARAG